MKAKREPRRASLKLRDKLFLSFSLLSVVILLAAAWVINTQVVDQARRQVQEEMKASLPLYDAVWEEQAGRLTALGMAMAGSPIVKTILGDPRASRDKETIRQMLAEFAPALSENVDLILITDGAGAIIFEESHALPAPNWSKLPAARAVATTQHPAQSFAHFGGRLLHLALTPVVSHSSNRDFDNTLAVLVAGSELNRKMAQDLRRRARSEILFFVGNRLYASSLPPDMEADAARTIAPRALGKSDPQQPTELKLGKTSQLAFARHMTDFEGETVGYVVVLHSLERAGQLFQAITKRLTLIGTIGILGVMLVSYLVARRVTRPIESLVKGAGEFGRGNYEYPLPAPAGGEVGQLATAFERMRLSIKEGQAELIRNERLATVGQMASGIIHDLRSPLAAISTAAELFSKSSLSGKQQQSLAQSQVRASQRMGNMLRELLEFSRGKYELRLESHPLHTIIESVIQELVTPEAAPGVVCEASIPPELIVNADRERLRRMFENLLVNSIQAMPEGGTIRIRAVKNGDKVQLNVSDSGPGIPANLRTRLFEPFVSRFKEGGTGLGLAIARSIAVAHGGSLTIVSADDQPADFCIEFPIHLETGNPENSPVRG